jgi:4-amino-4-deoxy-L-arabinose transferase-like glycosyltransferase
MMKGVKMLLWMLFGLAIYLATFLHMEIMPVGTWDESLFGLRAHYLFEEGRYLDDFSRYEGLHGHRNTKMPLVTFLQVAGYHLFGVNELGLRLPIALIFVATVLVFLFWSKKRLDTYLPGVIFGLILVSSRGWVAPHLLRTGDHDVPFTCFLFLSSLFFLDYLNRKRIIDLVLFTLFSTAALLTKNLLIGLMLPGLAVFLLWRRDLMNTLKDVKVYLALGALLSSYGLVILWLESQYPGFFMRMWNFELMGRFSSTIEGHQGGCFFYLDVLDKGMSPWSLLSPLLLLGFTPLLEGNKKDFVVLQVLLAVFFIIGLTKSSTKTLWYAAPLYVFISAGLAVIFSEILDRSWTVLDGRSFWAVYTIPVLIFLWPYSRVLQSVYWPDLPGKDHQCGKCIEKVAKTHPDIKTFYIGDKNFGTTAVWYEKKFEDLDADYDITFTRTWNFEEGDHILASVDHPFREIGELYEIDLLHESRFCRLFKVGRPKKSETGD